MFDQEVGLSLHDAARKGITKLKYALEIGPVKRVDIKIIEKEVGPWVTLHLFGIKEPQKHLLVDFLRKKEDYFDNKCFVPF